MNLAEADYAALSAVALESDVSLSWVIRQAIQRFVREHRVQRELPLMLADQADKKVTSG